MSSDSFVLQSTCKDGISRLRFSPKGNSESGKQLLLVSSWDCSVSLHDVELNSLVSQYRHPAAVLDCCFGESANKLYSGSLDRSVRCYDVETKIDSKVGSHDNGVRCLEYNTSAGVLVSGGWDNCIKLWDVKRVGENCVQSVPQPGKVFAMDTYGHQIIVAHAGRTLHVYDMRNLDKPLEGTQDKTHTESPLKFQTRCIKVFPDQSAYAIGSIEGRVAVEYFNATKSKFAFRCHRKKDANDNETIYPVNSIAFHPKYGTFATGGCDGSVSIWDAQNKKKISQFSGYDTSIASLDFSSDGSKLAIASSYTFEKGEIQNQPKDSIIIRNIKDEDVRPKARKK
mmetsp:Transcript_12752/g.16514  ORF Transcript_12752/g.16514 Transcript_12752/m.16514 type:complete len:340 (+) Transcript_12752:248-1267(+)